MMKIHVQVMHSKRIIEYEMRNTDMVGDVKKRIQEEIDVTANKLVLISGGMELSDGCLLFQCSSTPVDSSDHRTLQLVLPMISTSGRNCGMFYLVLWGADCYFV